MIIALINQFYPPSVAPTGRLLCDLAVSLRGRGHSVTVITSAGVYGVGQGAILPPDAEGVRVVRVGPKGAHRVGFVAKLSDFIHFFLSAYRTVDQLTPAPDVVVCMTTPPLCGLIAVRLKKNKGIPFILWEMDLYPEALAANRWLNPQGFLFCCLNRLARAERAGASGVVVLGEDMAGIVRRSAPEASVVTVPVWSHLTPDFKLERAAGELRKRRGWDAEDLVLLYSGNIGRAHRVDEFVALAERLGSLPRRVRMVFCGSGPLEEEWRVKLGDRVEWLGPVRGDDLVAHLLSADIHLVSQQAEWVGVVVPSKYQAACSLGRPVLFAGPAESAVGGWIQSADTGWIFPPDDSETLERVLRELMVAEQIREKGSNALQQARSLFDAETNIARIAMVIEGGWGWRKR